MDRRQFFTNFAKSATCSVSASPGSDFFTNAVFRTHENKEVRFYDDLIKDKHVVINFMYTRCEGSCPITTANLVKVQEALKKRVGRDIFMYSISLKPEEDDPATLKEYAADVPDEARLAVPDRPPRGYRYLAVAALGRTSSGH